MKFEVGGMDSTREVWNDPVSRCKDEKMQVSTHILCQAGGE